MPSTTPRTLTATVAATVAVTLAATLAGGMSAPAASAASRSQAPSVSAQAIEAQPGNNAMYLNWPDFPGATSYTTTVTDNNGNKTTSVDTTDSKATVSKLVNGTHYYFTIHAFSASGMTDIGTVEATPAPVAPQPANAPTLTASTRTTLTITVPALTMPAGAEPLTGYQIRLSAAGETPIVAAADTATRKATIDGLNTGQAYTIDYAGVNTVGGNPAIGPYSAKTLTATPTGAAAPTGVHALEGNKNVILDWDPVDGASKYTVYWRNDTGSESNASTTTAGASQLKITGLTNGNTYPLQVAAWTTINGVSKVGDRSAIVHATPVSPPAPSDLRVTGIGSGKAYLDWNPVPGAESYYLKAEVLNANGIPAPAVPAAVKIATTATATQKVISGLTNGVDYRIRVATGKDAVAGDYTNDASSATATPAAVPGTTNPTKVAVAPTSISIKWVAPTAVSGVDPADRYRVTYTPSNGGAAIVHDEVGTLSDTATGLITGVTYTISIQAGNAAGYGMGSTTPLVLVASDKPGAVRNPAVDRSVDGTMAGISWDTPNYTGGTSIKSYTVTPKQTNPVGTAPAAKTVTSGNFVNFTGLVAGADYTFTITATTDAGVGASVIVGSLAEGPSVSDPVSYNYDNGSVSMTWVKAANSRLSYQAQATQIPFGSSSTTIVLPATQSCDATSCTAVFDKFADNINGEYWSFRVRATDDVYSTSRWTLASVPELKAAASQAIPESEAHATCPEGAQLIGNGTWCRQTRAYTYHTETRGPVESYETAGGCPSGWNQEDYGWVKYCRRYESVTVRDATPAGWSDSGANWYQDSTPDTYVTYALAAPFAWTTESRASQGVINMLVEGSTVPGRSRDLGRCPGNISVSFTGLAGQSTGAFNMCN